MKHTIDILGQVFPLDQVLTILLLGLIAFCAWANDRYYIYADEIPVDNTHGGTINPPDKVTTFVKAFDMGLPFLLVYYALYIKNTPKSIYHQVVLGISLVAWIMVGLRPIGGGSINDPNNRRVDGIAKYVAMPLAAGSFLALPIMYL